MSNAGKALENKLNYVHVVESQLSELQLSERVSKPNT